MFDNLRQQSVREAGLEEEENTGPIIQPAQAAAPRRGARFLGLTPAQRFVLALMLFLNVTLLGCLALIAFELIDPARLLPF